MSSVHHIAIWTNDLERLKNFYLQYFGGRCGEMYASKSRPFNSYMISFGSDTGVELMHSPELKDSLQSGHRVGLAHIALSVGSKDRVNELTNILRKVTRVVSEPRTTGDGYYESCVEDPDGNLVEITI